MGHRAGTREAISLAEPPPGRGAPAEVCRPFEQGLRGAATRVYTTGPEPAVERGQPRILARDPLESCRRTAGTVCREEQRRSGV